jgi:C4-dicarboxylate transporter DctM subunit
VSKNDSKPYQMTNPPASQQAHAGVLAPFWVRGENLLVVMSLAVMGTLPLVEILLRRTLKTGISGSTSVVQHLTLIVGMVGGAIAAREGRLLSLATGSVFLKGWAKSASQVFSNSVAAAVCVFLCIAGFQFVQTELEAAKILAYGIPRWIIQALIPIGFGAIAGRLLWMTSSGWKGRMISTLLAAGWVGLCLCLPLPPEKLMLPALVILLGGTALGAPVFVTLGGAALILFWSDGLPIASVPVEHYRLVVNPTLPTIPLFTMAGYFLAEGGASRRFVRVFQTLFGHFRGGPAIVTALVCAFFTSFTGASGVTILALGGLLMPILIAARYSEKSALGLLTGAGSLGLLFPPCLPLILYAIVSNTVTTTEKSSAVTIEQMFLGGILPGIVMVIATACLGIRQGPKEPIDSGRFDLKEAGRALWTAKWELLLPVVALGSLLGGFATPVEAAAVTALYAFVVEVFVYRDLRIGKDVARVMTECGLLVGGVLLILGVALGFTSYLIIAQVPARGMEWVTASIHSPWLFLLLLNLFLLVVGCLMDIFSAIVVVVPLIVPMGEAYHIDPVHLGIIFLANLELGYLTPPVGMNLFLSSYRFKKPLPEVYRSIVPMLLVLLVGVLLITYIPPLTTTLPRWFGR